MAKNYYEILGIQKNASQDDIKSAYRKLARQYHPDLHPNDEECVKRFKEINEANEVLSDPDKRKKYDFELENPGASAFGGFGSGGSANFSGFDFGDIFGDIFGGFGRSSQAEQSKAGEDITLEVELSFLDACKGCTKEVSYTRKEPCADCNSMGAKKGTSYKTCTKCNGRGTIQYATGSSIFRQIVNRACDACGGSGKIIIEKCPTCNGKGYQKKNTKIAFNIPAGADTGSYITKRGYGDASTSGGPTGDLNVVFKVLPHRIFKRKNFDLYIELPIDFVTASLGGTVKIPTLDNCVDLEIPAGIQSGKVLVVKNKGIQTRRETGNLYVTVIVEMPTKLTREQTELLRTLNKTLEVKQHLKMKKFTDDMDILYKEKPYNK